MAANIKINAEDAALTLDAKQGIVTNGKNVDIEARTLYISAKEDAIVADGGKVTSLGMTNINNEDKTDNPAA